MSWNTKKITNIVTSLAKKDLAPLLVLVTTKVYEPCEEIPFCMYSNSASGSVVVAYGYGSWIRVSIYHLMLENCVNGPSFDNVAMLLILSRCIFYTLTLGWALFQKVFDQTFPLRTTNMCDRG